MATINDKYSFKDFTGQDFSKVDPKEFNDTEIVGSCFYQEDKPNSIVFPPNMKAVTFRRCNLDNVMIPGLKAKGKNANAIIGDGPDACTNKRIKVQPPTPKAKPEPEDAPDGGMDWVVDEANKPVEPLHKQQFIDEERSVDPKDIPEHHYVEIEMSEKEAATITDNDWAVEMETGNKPLHGKHQWFKEKPEVTNTRQETVTVTITSKEWMKWQALEKYGDFDEKPENITPLKSKPGEVILKGTVTYKTYRGKAWLIRGEKKTDIRPKV